MQVSGRKGRGDVERSSNKPGHDLYCVPCQRDDENNEAFGYCQDCTEHLCETCYKSHRKARSSISHVLLDKQRMPTRMSEQTKSVTLGCRVPCSKHADKIIEFFCCDHNKVFCYVCSTLDHTHCKKEYITDISKSFVAVQDFQAKIVSLLQQCTHITDYVNGTVETVERNVESTLGDFLKFRQEIIDLLDTQELEIK